MLPSSFFVSNEIVAREVELPDGSRHDLHFRVPSAIAYRRFLVAESSQDVAVRASSPAHLIAATLCDAEGKLVLTFDQACQLNPAAMAALFRVANSLLEELEPGKPSKRGARRGSGTSSRSRSVGAR